jgi:hypothetical protein
LDLSFPLRGRELGARALLGWTPSHASLLDDLATGDYFPAQAA